MKLKRILIIGGYGNFGRYIAQVLGQNTNIKLIIAGRRIHKAQELISSLELANSAEAIYCDIFKNIKQTIQDVNANIVIHTSGPFQSQDHIVAKVCIEAKAHYIDLSDSREFVTKIDELDQTAKTHEVLIVSGASSVPGLSSAIIDNYLPEFSEFT